ncbi:sex hormone-binding globulin [Brachyhypopomus gauderio]|uniref:sex hormone-binding globulin n=1 Tax=Brachyhypopomus gauderio TaxID=698409 RepID=UPI00404370D9
MKSAGKVSLLLLLCQYFSWQRLSAAAKISGAEVINLGQRQPSWLPLMQTCANLSDVASIRSFFDFRTFDPEGTIFYGDTKNGRDWFVLLLRDGVPEMQIGKANILVSVRGGRKLNDGTWHKLELRNEGQYVIMEVNGKVELEVGLNSDQTEDTMMGEIRLALGGVLVDQTKLLRPFKPELDACIRAGHWLNLSMPWDTDPSWELQPCFPEVKKGSYFPGTGLAMFNTSDLPGVETEEKGVSIEVYGSWHGTLLSLQSAGFEYVLSEKDTFKKDKATPNEKEEGPSSGNTAPAPSTPRVTLTVLKHSLMLDGETHHEAESFDFLSMWSEGMLLTFGGVPGKTKEAKSSHHLQGCLEKILIQEQVIDLDLASFKDTFVSSHSCPAKAMNETFS